MTKIENGMTVKVHYKGTFEDGKVFDSSENKEPLTFTVGQRQVIKGFEEAVIGMSEGEEKDFTLQPDEAYGQPKPELVQKVPKEQLGDLKPEVGMVLGMQVPGVEQVFPATVTEVADDTVTVDLNPPLAGKVLNFHIKIESVEKPSA